MGTLESIIIISVLLSFVFLWMQSRKRRKSVVNINNINKTKKPTPVVRPAENIDKPASINAEIATYANQGLEIPQHFVDFKLQPLSALPTTKVTEVTSCMRKPNPLLLKLTRRDYEAKELYQLIKTDPEMSALILKEVNSPLFSLDKAITSVNHAIVFLGASKVKDIVIQCCVKNSEFSDPIQRQAYDRLWAASHMASSIAFIIAKQLGQEAPANMSTICLLSYLGDQAIISALPEAASIYLDEEMSFFERVYNIQQQYAVNKVVIAQALVTQWGLPAELIANVENFLLLMPHNDDELALESEFMLQNLICYLACAYAEAIVYQKVDGIETLLPQELAANQALAFINVQAAIKHCSGDKLNELLSSAAFIKQVNKLITH
ncbi:MAG: HDOD domain-containing protein [Oceanospirillaceae bacterium]|nr:HDOD domain-containing protein [Oceanospirillaceae bacterium]